MAVIRTWNVAEMDNEANLGVIGHIPDVSLDAFPVRAGTEVFPSVLFLFCDPTSRFFRVVFEPIVRIRDFYGAPGFAFIDIDVIRTTGLRVSIRDPSVGSHRGQGEPTKRTRGRGEGGSGAGVYERQANSGLSTEKCHVDGYFVNIRGPSISRRPPGTPQTQS